MNSEELEQSLRAEFDSHIKTVIADMKQEVSDFKGNVESELEKHKAHLDEMFKEFSEKFDKEIEFDASFTESVSEHLKLARDEGAKITAAAIAEAEEMREEEEASQAQAAADDFSDIRDAINEISSKDSQAEILKSLVHHAGQFTSRGAFFIVKNEHLVGWRVFGTEEHPNPDVVREVYFPISSNTSLSESVESLATVSTGFGSHEGDSQYLDTLGFGQPENMYAIPLIARGRGVAALYADKGEQGGDVNIEALETLVRVAGLTVEVLASAPAPAKPKVEEAPAPSIQEEFQQEQEQEEESHESSQGFVAPVQTEGWASPEEQVPEAEEAPQQFESEPVTEEYEVQPVEETQPAQEENTWDQPVEEVQEEVSEFSPEPASDFESPGDLSAPEADVQDFSTAYEPVVEEEAAPAAEEFQPDSEFEYTEEAPSQVEESSPAETSEVEFQQEPSQVEETPQAETPDFSFAETPSQIEETPQTEEVNQFDTSEPVESSEFEAAPEPSQFEVPSVPIPAVDDFSSINETPTESFDFEGDLSESSLTGQAVETQSGVEAPVVEAPVEEAAPAPPVRSRFGDRNVDLPIEVAEDERRYHNDARRFARLLVSEIKLYNEQKVKEGRDTSDLYERLREAIDRSREMYDKRVQPPVAAKFDYFNYELVNTLAEGDEGKLGGSYPGANA